MLLLIAGAATLVLSFGKYMEVGGTRIPLPGSILFHLPGFGNARAVSRFVIVAFVVLSILVARGFVRLTDGRSDLRVALAAGAVGIFMLAEYACPITMAGRVGRFRDVGHNRLCAARLE